MIFDFRQWRIDRRLTQKEAGALLGASSGFWGDMESGKSKPHKQLAVVRVLSYHNEHWGRLSAAVKQLSPELITEFIEAQKAKDPKITLKAMSHECGLSKSTLGNLARGNNDFATVGTQVKFMICAYMLECSGLVPAPVMEQVSEEELVTVTVPATADLPERTFTPDDVVVTVGEPAVVPQATQDDFERIEYILIDGVPMWRLVDVCRAIEYKNPAHAKKLVREADIQKCTLANDKGELVSQWVVNEYGLLRILAKSGAPKADDVERWMFEYVLPKARKDPNYLSPTTAPTIVTALELQLQAAKQIEAQQRQLDEMQQRVQQLEERPVKGASADDVVDKLMELDGMKTQLHDLVHELVRTARYLPQHHPMREDYSSYSKVWHKAFKAANPPVSKKAEYRKENQILPSLDVLRTALAFIKNTTLPEVAPATPSQLTLNI